MSNVSPPIVSAIYVYPTAGAAPMVVNTAMLEVNRGIVGDRYHAGIGSFSRWPGEGRDVTLIPLEGLDALFAQTGIDLHHGLARRNLETHGFVPAGWINRKFRIGDVVLRGARLCLPCMRLERLTRPGAYAAMRDRGGLRANVLIGGTIHVGDTIEPA